MLQLTGLMRNSARLDLMDEKRIGIAISLLYKWKTQQILDLN